MSTVRMRLSALAFAGLPALSPFAAAEAEPPSFEWINPLGGDWHDAANWTPLGVPGAGNFVGADVTIHTPLEWPRLIIADSEVSLRDLVLDTFATLIFYQSLTVSRDLIVYEHENAATLRAVNGMSVGNTLRLERNAELYCTSAPLSAGSVTNAGHIQARTFTANQIQNSGLLDILPDGAIEAATIINTGEITFGRYDGVIPGGTRSVIHAVGGIINEGAILTNRQPLEIYADIVHRGVIGVRSGFDYIDLYGNHTFEHGAEVNSGRVLFRNTSDDAKVMSGRVSAPGGLSIYEGSWIFENLDVVGDFSTYDSSATLRFVGDFNAHGAFISSAATLFEGGITASTLQVITSEPLHFLGVVSASSITLSAPEVYFTKRVESDVSAVLSGGRYHFMNGYAFSGDLRLSNIHASFDNGLSVNGDLRILGVNELLIGGTEPIRIGGDLLWQTPLQEVNSAIVVEGHADITARGILEPITAETMRITGISTLSADLTASSGQVWFAQNAVAVGGNDNLAAISIDGDFLVITGNHLIRAEIAPGAERGQLSSDLLTVTGRAALTGTLQVSTLGDADAFIAGQQFVLLTASEVFGQFSTVSLPTLNDGLSLDFFQTETTVGLRVVPTPGTACLGMLGLAARRRRRSPPAKS